MSQSPNSQTSIPSAQKTPDTPTELQSPGMPLSYRQPVRRELCFVSTPEFKYNTPSPSSSSRVTVKDDKYQTPAAGVTCTSDAAPTLAARSHHFRRANQTFPSPDLTAGVTSEVSTTNPVPKKRKRLNDDKAVAVQSSDNTSLRRMKSTGHYVDAHATVDIPPQPIRTTVGLDLSPQIPEDGTNNQKLMRISALERVVKKQEKAIQDLKEQMLMRISALEDVVKKQEKLIQDLKEQIRNIKKN